MSSSHETMDVHQEGRRIIVTLDRPKALNAQNEAFLRDLLDVTSGLVDRDDFDAVGSRRAEGVLAPSQWEEGLRIRPTVGPRSVDVLRTLRFRLAPGLAPGTAAAHVEYPAAQAYAAVVIALRCVTETGGFDDEALRTAARRLRCTTFFGRFGLAGDGRQSDHDLVVVQWQNGAKCIVGPPGLAERSAVLSA